MIIYSIECPLIFNGVTQFVFRTRSDHGRDKNPLRNLYSNCNVNVILICREILCKMINIKKCLCQCFRCVVFNFHFWNSTANGQLAGTGGNHKDWTCWYTPCPCPLSNFHHFRTSIHCRLSKTRGAIRMNGSIIYQINVLFIFWDTLILIPMPPIHECNKFVAINKAYMPPK